MNSFSVWAPAAQLVELEIGGGRISMRSAGDGWWSVEDVGAEAGTDYAFVIDGGEALPDPRSNWQPHGVHGPSHIVDHESFAWPDHGWQPRPLSAAVLYELHIGTFTPEGTFNAAIDRLPDLVNLGITHVEFMPVVEFSGNRGWGYDGVDLYAPHHAYGTPQDLKRLIAACHAACLAVILDVVYNHLGPSGNYLERFGPYFSNRHRTPWGPAINFDGPESDQVRRFFCDNALMWLRDYHFDGLRLDAVHTIIDTSAVHFLEQLASEVAELQAQIQRRLVLIAESDLNDPRIIRPQEIGGYGLDAQWNDDFHHALHVALTEEQDGYYADFKPLDDLVKALKQGFVYDHRYSVVRRRHHGRRPVAVSGHSLIGCMQNHDQIGNRAKGERSSQLMNLGRLKIAAALVLTAHFVPMLFQGEEWGASPPFLYFTDHEDPELGRAVTEGRRREFATFGWRPEEIPDPQERETFERCKLNWVERYDEPHAGLLKWHMDLIQLRREIPGLTDGRLGGVEISFDEAAKWLSMKRGSLLVICNLNRSTQFVPFPLTSNDSLLLASDPNIELFPTGVRVPSDSVAIISIYDQQDASKTIRQSSENKLI